MICFCCGQIYTSWIGQSRVIGVDMSLDQMKSPIACFSGKYFMSDLLRDTATRRNCFEERVFRERYMQPDQPLSMACDLAENCWEWRQILRYENGIEIPVLCCPEDVKHCKDHESHVICKSCTLPLCHRCALLLRRQEQIPMAIANHNFIGYVSPTMVACILQELL